MSPAIQHTIAIHQVAQMLLGVEREVDRAALLRRAGIAPALLESGLARVTQQQYARLMSALVRSQRDELCGLGSSPMPLGTFATGCRLLVGHRRLGDAIRAGLRYYHAVLPDFVPRLQVDGATAYLRLGARRGMQSRQIYAARVFMFFSYGVMCWLAARRIPAIDALVDAGNTLIVVEHNLDVIKTADWIIDLGPEGGVRGGEIVAEGTPEQVAKAERSFTGRYLGPLLG